VTTSWDIAREVGVTQSTVSRALNGGPVAEGTRARILDAAARRGYAVNAVARGLVTSRSRLVGVVVADVTNPFYPELIEAIGTRLTANGRNMLLANVGNGDDEAHHVKLLLEHRVEGIIFTSAMANSVAVRRLAADGFPIVLTNREVDGIDCDVIVGDNHAGAEAAAEHLLELGHRRIALLTGQRCTSTSRDRETAFKARLRHAGVALYRRAEAGFDQQTAFEASITLLSEAKPPTAIMCVNDLMAFGALNAARHLGLNVPDDVSVVGFDDIPMASWDTFRLTTVRQPLSAMAQEAADALDRRITSPEPQPKRLVFPSELIVRQTTSQSGVSKAKGRN